MNSEALSNGRSSIVNRQSAPARWPASMKLATLAEYLDCSETVARQIVNAAPEFGAVQYTERGDRRYLREDADAYLARIAQVPVRSPRAS